MGCGWVRIVCVCVAVLICLWLKLMARIDAACSVAAAVVKAQALPHLRALSRCAAAVRRCRIPTRPLPSTACSCCTG